MQELNEITKVLPIGHPGSPEKATPAKPQPMRNAAMRKLWARMAAIYGHKWTTAYGERCDDDSGALTVTGDTWARGLAGMAERMIGDGLNAALMSAEA